MLKLVFASTHSANLNVTRRRAAFSTTLGMRASSEPSQMGRWRSKTVSPTSMPRGANDDRA